MIIGKCFLINLEVFKSLTQRGVKSRAIPARIILLPYFIGHNLVLTSPLKHIRNLNGLPLHFCAWFSGI